MMSLTNNDHVYNSYALILENIVKPYNGTVGSRTKT